MILGLRPKDIYDCKFAPPLKSPYTRKAKLDVVEPMGDQVFLHLRSGDKIFTVRVYPRTEARMGQEVEVLVNMENVHLFAPPDREGHSVRTIELRRQCFPLLNWAYWRLLGPIAGSMGRLADMGQALMDATTHIFQRLGYVTKVLPTVPAKEES